MEEKKFRNKLSKGMGDRLWTAVEKKSWGGHTGAEGLPALSLKHMGVLGVHFSILISTSSICS